MKNNFKDALYAIFHPFKIFAENRELREKNADLECRLKEQTDRAHEFDLLSEELHKQVKEQKTQIKKLASAVDKAVDQIRKDPSADAAFVVYNAISPFVDPDGFELFDAAQQILGPFEYSHFAYEDARGYFEFANGQTMLRYLLVQYEDKLGQPEKNRWQEACSCYEECVDLSCDKTTPEYQEFEKQLYAKVVELLSKS